MISNYLLTAVRFFGANWRPVLINIVGLATGLFVFFLATSLQEHERQHDGFFDNAENIFGVYTRVLPTAGFGTSRVYGSPPVIGPLVAENIVGVEASSRYIESRQAVRVDQFSAYESVKFVDPDFTDIFSFEFLAGGGAEALESGTGVIITREAALRYFGRVDALGESLRLGGQLDLAVMAVIEDLPANSHFVYRFGTANRLQIIAPVAVLESLGEATLLNDWGYVSDTYRLWLKLNPGIDPEQVAANMTDFLAGHIDATGEDIVGGFSLLKLTDWNLHALAIEGISLISVAVGLCGFVLLVAVLNYSNLFTAMIARRLKELAVRKTLGATRYQLSSQIFIESVLLTTLAALCAFAAMAAALPVMGSIVGKEIAFANLISPDLGLTVITVILVTAFLSVIYPVYVVNRLATAHTLRGSAFRGRGGARLRFSLVVLQFALNAILGTLMATTYFQNQHLLVADRGFNSDDVVIVYGVADPMINRRLDTLTQTLQNLPEVLSVAGASQHPFQEIHNQGRFTTNAEATADYVNLYRFAVEENFFNLYDIDSVSGRLLNRTINNDAILNAIETPVINVLVNQSALQMLGFDNASLAIDQVFFSNEQNQPRQSFRIVGVVSDSNLLGLANDIKPSVFRLEPGSFNSLSIRINPAASATALASINAAWLELFPEIPVESAFLQDIFRSRYEIFAGINRVLVGLSVVSLLLATFGLYGLICVLTQQRSYEIAIRKVLGATAANLVKLLSWQFTKPVSLALVLGAPVGMLAAGQYLSLFAERIDGAGMIALAVSGFILVLAWLTISGQILQVAQQNPANDLRCE
ncbi:MAG: ABC transporter permease [Proteobacteria bacterium]|nr:ABC transporter permease [Pseudomonadota bacterium]